MVIAKRVDAALVHTTRWFLIAVLRITWLPLRVALLVLMYSAIVGGIASVFSAGAIGSIVGAVIGLIIGLQVCGAEQFERQLDRAARKRLKETQEERAAQPMSKDLAAIIEREKQRQHPASG